MLKVVFPPSNSPYCQVFTGLSIPSVTDFYIGGYPGSDYDDITDTAFFTGCIKDGIMGPDNIDVSETAEGVTRRNVGSECTRKVNNSKI